MLTAIIVGLIIISLGAGFMFVIEQYPGYILFRIGDFAIEVNLWFFVAALVFGIVVLYFCIRLIAKSFNSFFGGLSWFKSLSGRKSERLTLVGLKHFIVGDWEAAKKELIKAAKTTESPIVHYLAAAKSASELGQEEETGFLLAQAERYADKDEAVLVLMQARKDYRTGEYDSALARLDKLSSYDEKNPVVLDLKCQIFFKKKDWPACVGILPQVKSTKVYSAAVQAELEERVYLGLFDQVSNEKGVFVSSLEGFWRDLPKDVRKKPVMLEKYVSILHDNAQDDLAESVIKKSLKSEWQPRLVDLYGRLEVQDIKSQLATAESWLKEHKDDADLYFALGKISASNELWGRAREYFEKSLVLHKSPQVYAALGDLLVKLGEKERSTSLYREGLAVAAERATAV